MYDTNMKMNYLNGFIKKEIKREKKKEYQWNICVQCAYELPIPRPS